MRENNSTKKWYKQHVPKGLRKGLTNRERMQMRIRFFHDKIRCV